ncbi:MAG: archease [Nevskia sp.]|nr:archease [Nevskia sp.]
MSVCTAPPQERPAPGWEHFAHMADIGVRGRGASLAQAFESVALALTAVVISPAQVAPTTAVDIACPGSDPELLLVDWLNALIYEMAARRMLFGKFEVRIGAEGLRATAWGEPVDRSKHAPAVEIKGATFTELAVRETGDGTWLAQCVVDI